jgi:hypothetical protein
MKVFSAKKYFEVNTYDPVNDILEIYQCMQDDGQEVTPLGNGLYIDRHLDEVHESFVVDIENWEKYELKGEKE